MIVKIFYDVETTGLNYKRHCVHQVAGFVEVDGVIKEEFNIKSRPHPKAKIEQEALNTCGVTIDQIMAYPPYDRAYRAFNRMLGKYIDRYDPECKAWLIGYNNRAFDDYFLRMWFELCNDVYIGSWFWADTIDVLVLASQYLIDRRSNMPSFKLSRVAKELGIEVEDEKLHDAFYDVYLTREIYRIVTNLEIEI